MTATSTVIVGAGGAGWELPLLRGLQRPDARGARRPALCRPRRAPRHRAAGPTARGGARRRAAVARPRPGRDARRRRHRGRRGRSTAGPRSAALGVVDARSSTPTRPWPGCSTASVPAAGRRRDVDPGRSAARGGSSWCGAAPVRRAGRRSPSISRSSRRRRGAPDAARRRRRVGGVDRAAARARRVAVGRAGGAARGRTDGRRRSTDCLQPGPDGLAVLAGLPRAELWPEVRPEAWRAVLDGRGRTRSTPSSSTSPRRSRRTRSSSSTGSRSAATS